MKFTFTLFFLLVGVHMFAQWSDTNNLFADSLHMQVTSAIRNQGAPLTVRSYPDSGYFVIWQDARNDQANAKTRIYVQKYDKSGAALWAANGVAVSSSTNNQHYTGSGQDYRNHSYAATDSAGGFYITYADDSVTNYVYQRTCVQHMKSDGTAVFAGAGYIVKSSENGNFNMNQQLIGDGYGGFFISFIQSPAVSGSTTATPDILNVYCYKDLNGTLQNYGGGQVNGNAIQTTNTSPCGIYTDVTNIVADVNDYHIFSDLQGGCNVVMYLSANGAQGKMLAYNKLFRAKKNATATQYAFNDTYNPVQLIDYYQQGNVYRLYYLKTDYQTIRCTSSTTAYVVTQHRLLQNGFQEIDGASSVYDLNDPKGVTVSTAGNINVALLAAWKRTYSQLTGVSSAVIQAYSIKDEVFDSIPYQRASDTDPNYPGYNTTEPGSLNKLSYFRDTILPAPSLNNYDFSLSGGSNQIYSSTIGSSGQVRLQHLAVEQQSADSFAIVYKTNQKQGVVIGSGIYEVPFVAVNNNGNGLFYVCQYDDVNQNNGSVRVSPIFSGAQLAWGAMGQRIGTGHYNGNYIMYTPSASLDPVNGTALVSWTDTRNNGTTGYDIYMRRLDGLNDPNYQPPYRRLRSLPGPYGPVTTSAVLYGTTNKLTTFEAYSSYGNDPGVSPVVDISDNYNLGTVNVSVSDNTAGIRTSNGKPYLDRSFTITPQNNPNGAATVTVRLFFTTAQFNALKAADASIKTPGDLAVVKQPSGSGSTYAFVAGEQTVIPQTWGAVDGGYYIEIQISSFSNFFIFKNTNSALPITWLGVQAQWQNTAQAKVTWQVAEQQNVKNYVVQHSIDAVSFSDVYSVNAANQTQYNCVVPAGSSSNYYRVMETDIAGEKTYSRVVQLQGASPSTITIYPNPANNILYIKGIGNYTSLQVIDVQGKVVQQRTVTFPEQLLNITGLSKGNYLLKLANKTEVQTLKFSKE